MMRENMPGGDPGRANGCTHTGRAKMAATQAAASTHLVYSQAAESMGHQGYTHFHQCRIRGPPRLCQRSPGGVTVEDRILLCQMINHFLWNPQMLRVHSKALEGRAVMVPAFCREFGLNTAPCAQL